MDYCRNVVVDYLRADCALLPLHLDQERRAPKAAQAMFRDLTILGTRSIAR